MAPLGIRYVVIPIIDRVHSTSSSPLPAPSGLVESFSGQLDLEKVYSPPSMVIFENAQWIPVSSLLSASALVASQTGGPSALVSSELSGSAPFLTGTNAWNEVEEVIGSGTVHWGVPYSTAWSLERNGSPVASRPSFGSVMAFDLAEGGSVVLRYDGSVSRQIWIAFQFLLWSTVLVAAVQPRRRRRRVPVAVEGGPVFSLNDPQGFVS
jgi:hypothetical protein